MTIRVFGCNDYDVDDALVCFLLIARGQGLSWAAIGLMSWLLARREGVVRCACGGVEFNRALSELKRAGFVEILSERSGNGERDKT